jgi:hypothetical protein
VAEQQAHALVSTMDVQPTADPAASLLAVCGEMEALSSALRDRVARLSEISITDRTGAQDVAAELQAYERSLDRLARTLVAVNKLGLDERLVTVQERQWALLAEAVRDGVFSPAAGLTYDQAQQVLSAIAAEITRQGIAA